MKVLPPLKVLFALVIYMKSAPVRMRLPVPLIAPVNELETGELKVLAPFKTMLPAAVALLNEMVPPFIIKFSLVVTPVAAKVAPLPMVVFAAVLPRPFAFVILNVPVLIKVWPEYVLLPDKVVVPASSLVKVPAPLMMPLKVSVPAPPTVVATAFAMVPDNEAVPVPVIVPVFDVMASAPMATLLMLSVAPLAMVVPPAVVPSAVAFEAVRVPALIVVKPV